MMKQVELAVVIGKEGNDTPLDMTHVHPTSQFMYTCKLLFTTQINYPTKPI